VAGPALNQPTRRRARHVVEDRRLAGVIENWFLLETAAAAGRRPAAAIGEARLQRRQQGLPPARLR